MEVEKLATSAVKTSLGKTERLSSFLLEGDKEPSWDGNIYIHEDSTHSKKNMKKVPAQVKGKLVKGTIKETIKYPVSILDLKAYQRNGGTLYFVVYLDSKTGDVLQIYYAFLLPFKIAELLKGKINTKSLSVTFSKFPDSNEEKTQLLLNYYSNASMQSSFAEKKLPTLEELKKQGTLEGLTLQYTGLKTDPKTSIFSSFDDGKEMFVYANVKGSPIPIPVEYYESVYKITTSSEINTPIYVDKTKHFDSYELIKGSKTTTIRIGNCLSLEFPNAENESDEEIKINVSISIKGTLNQRLMKFPFIKNLFRRKSFKIGNITFPFDFKSEQLTNIHYDEFDNTIEYLQSVKRVLKKLHIKKDLDLDKCTQDDYRKLDILLAAIEEQGLIYGIENNLPYLVNLNIANIHLKMLCEKSDDGGYYLWDFFSKIVPVVFMGTNNTPSPTSQYSILKKDDFLEIDNLNYQSIVNDFQRINPQQEVNVDIANLTLLEMLKAYDEKQAPELLNSLRQLSKWLNDQTDFISYEITKINQLQIEARHRKLTFAEKQELVKIAENSNEPLYKVGAFILLEEVEEANSILNTLDTNEAESFKTYPIYHLIKLKENSTNG